MFFLFSLNQAFSFSWRHMGQIEGNQNFMGFVYTNNTFAAYTHPKNQTYKLLKADRLQLVHIKSFKAFILVQHFAFYYSIKHQ